jgi:hypothetical protein
MMERAIGTTFKFGNDELIVKEIDKPVCSDEHGVRCYFYKLCFYRSPFTISAGYCLNEFRKDGKNVIFIKK